MILMMRDGTIYLIEVPGPVKRAPACYQPVS